MGKTKTRKNKKLLRLSIVILLFIIFVVIVLFYVEYLSPGKFSFLKGIFDETPVVSEIPDYIDAEHALRIYFIDVGQGDSILLRFPCGTDFLIDAGSGTNAGATRISSYLAALDATGLDDLEYMIATHPDSDHINMLDDVLETYEVHNIYYNDYMHTSATFEKFLEAAETETYGENEQAALTLFDEDGDQWNILGVSGECYSVKIYAPGYGRFENNNAMSPFIIAEYGGRKVMLTGDAEACSEQWFLQTFGQNSLDCDILKVAHHGSDTSSSAEFLNFVTCEYAVISVGENNAYGHPDDETLTKLYERNYSVYRTDLDGTIICYIDREGDVAFVTEK